VSAAAPLSYSWPGRSIGLYAWLAFFLLLIGQAFGGERMSCEVQPVPWRRARMALSHQGRRRSSNLLVSGRADASHGADYAMPNLLNHLVAPGCSRIGSNWDRCGVHYVEPNRGRAL